MCARFPAGDVEDAGALALTRILFGYDHQIPGEHAADRSRVRDAGPRWLERGGSLI